MNFLARLLRPGRDDRSGELPLWQAIVAAARQRRWYAELGVADSVAGRFDMVSLVLALVLLRLEREQDCAGSSARLTELFVQDMDGQLRESGVGDLVVGKHIGRLISVLGGRLGALREALAAGDDPDALTEAVRRNVTLADDGRAAALAVALREFADTLGRREAGALLAGELP
jgi:cytochrome b pre-mRNA-processing protein 3